MSQNFSLKTYAGRNLLILVFLIFGLLSSKALISIGTALLLINFLFSFRELKVSFVNLSVLSILAPNLAFVSACLLFVFAPNYQIALLKLWSTLPWLAIPLSIAFMPKVPKQYVYLLVAFLIIILNISGIIVLINYYYNLDFYLQQIAQGKHIPVPMNHIRFSIMLAFAGSASIYFFIKNNTLLSPYDRYFFGFSSVFIFILLHILSVRSGVACYYASLIFLVIYFSVAYKKWIILPLLIIGILSTPFIAYKTIPSFKNKIDYSYYDFLEYKKGNLGHNSDGRRWKSIEIAWQLFKAKPIVGYGLGQVEPVSIAYYQKHYPAIEDYNQKIPHNQFLFTLVELGLAGLIFLVAALIFPLVLSFKKNNPLFIILSIVIILSCLVENTLDSHLGMSFYLVFASLTLKLNEHE